MEAMMYVKFSMLRNKCFTPSEDFEIINFQHSKYIVSPKNMKNLSFIP